MSLKGVILAGGTGSRLLPLTKVTNKHLLPVGRAPMIYYPIMKLTDAGVEEILIVTGVEHMGGVVGLLGSGKDFGCNFTYKVQDVAGGIAQALALAENFAAGDSIVVILGDNIFQEPLKDYIDKFSQQMVGAMVLLKQVPDPQRFGVVEILDGAIVSIEEKPENPKSDCAVTGIYFYDSQVFDFIKQLKPSDRGEFEITHVNQYYVEKGQMTYSIMPGWWTDAGTFDSLRVANELVGL